MMGISFRTCVETSLHEYTDGSIGGLVGGESSIAKSRIFAAHKILPLHTDFVISIETKPILFAGYCNCSHNGIISRISREHYLSLLKPP